MAELFGDNVFSLCLAGRPGVDAGLTWSLAPEVVLPVIIFALVYSYGVWRLISRKDPVRPTTTELGLFASGMVMIALAVISPLCRLASTMAWAHMVQHAILVVVAPPLILLGRPGAVFAAAMPRSFPSAKFVRSPALATTVYGMAIWFWHGPRFYQAGLLDATVHLAMYASLLAAAFIFWRAVIEAIRSPGGQSGIMAVCLLVTIIHTGLLGALLTFSHSLWYPLVSAQAGSWGLSPLEDQELAGLIMWVPMGMIYIVAALAVIGAWVNTLTAVRAADARSSRPWEGSNR
jgi:putative membrane protein